MIYETERGKRAETSFDFIARYTSLYILFFLVFFPTLVFAKLTYLGHAESTTNASSYSFTTQPFGTEDIARYIIVGASATSGNFDVTGIEIGGSGATILVSKRQGTTATALAIRKVPTGTTGTITVNFGGTKARAGIGIWSMTCLLYTSPSPRDRSLSRMPSSA